ncbi:hypothetical protein NC652_018170 [Populus alba x Populus x berolinensis]|nr:hypothetical protein NC652_018170 [Populus alba x Populus x berolinensis]
MYLWSRKELTHKYHGSCCCLLHGRHDQKSNTSQQVPNP